MTHFPTQTDLTEWNYFVYGSEDFEEVQTIGFPLSDKIHNRDVKESLRNNPTKIKEVLKTKYDTVELQGGKDDIDSYIMIYVTVNDDIELYGKRDAEFNNFLNNYIIEQ